MTHNNTKDDWSEECFTSGFYPTKFIIYFFPSKNHDLAWYFTVKLATQPENYK